MLKVSFESGNKIKKQFYFPDFYKRAVFDHFIQQLCKIDGIKTQNSEDINIRVEIEQNNIQNAIDILVGHDMTIGFLQDARILDQDVVIHVCRFNLMDIIGQKMSKYT